ncbi:MAG TPA: PAAR domain-containing protein [Gemmatimonadales bacterium]|jgi:uncharacterized Zn-binding protein involved in type VI secretion
MLEPAARISDMHTCPVMEPVPTGNGTITTFPHVGGPILPPGSADVMIAGQPAAMVGTRCTCTGPASNYLGQLIHTIATGSSTVRINGKAAARRGDRTQQNGVITGGAPTVLIGG